MKLIQFISFSIALIVVKGSVIAQSNIKPYIKDSNGVITYYDEVKEGFSRKQTKKIVKPSGYTVINSGTETSYFAENVSSLNRKGTNKLDKTPIVQNIFIRVNWSTRDLNLSQNDGMWIYKIDQEKALSKCIVLFANNDTLLLHARMAEGIKGSPRPIAGPGSTTGSSMQGGAPEQWRYVLKIGDKLHYIGSYLKKTKTQKSYQVLINAFSGIPEVKKLAIALSETKAIQQNKMKHLFNQINLIYLENYFVEL